MRQKFPILIFTDSCKQVCCHFISMKTTTKVCCIFKTLVFALKTFKWNKTTVYWTQLSKAAMFYVPVPLEVGSPGD